MTTYITSLFSTRKDAERAVEELKDQGVDSRSISIIVQDTVIGERLEKDTGADIAAGAGSGATAGAILGGLVGLLTGIGAILIPGIGGLLIAGPVAAALGITGAAGTTVAGALTGALAGGLVGGLLGLGFSEEKARIYEDKIKSGAIMLAVPTDQIEGDEHHSIRTILEKNNGEEIQTVTK